MSKEVKRFDPYGYDGLSALMHEDVLGDYVRHEDYDALLAERDALLEALEEICECPRHVDEATIPRSGIESAPQQVVMNMSVGLVRLRRARAAIAKAQGDQQ